MFTQSTWCVAAWLHEVQAEDFVARTITGMQVFFYRIEDGGIAALEDRCSHRGVPLSLGRREWNKRSDYRRRLHLESSMYRPMTVRKPAVINSIYAKRAVEPNTSARNPRTKSITRLAEYFNNLQCA